MDLASRDEERDRDRRSSFACESGCSSVPLLFLLLLKALEEKAERHLGDILLSSRLDPSYSATQSEVPGYLSQCMMRPHVPVETYIHIYISKHPLCMYIGVCTCEAGTSDTSVDGTSVCTKPAWLCTYVQLGCICFVLKLEEGPMTASAPLYAFEASRRDTREPCRGPLCMYSCAEVSLELILSLCKKTSILTPAAIKSRRRDLTYHLVEAERSVSTS